MEPAWENVCGRNFSLTSRTIIQPNGGTREVPCYQLTKTECLYIATKFNDEARAKLVLRWQELEKEDVRCKTEEGRGKMGDEHIHFCFCILFFR
jgi:phage regulator Rha-like protein